MDSHIHKKNYSFRAIARGSGGSLTRSVDRRVPEQDVLCGHRVLLAIGVFRTMNEMGGVEPTPIAHPAIAC